MARFGTFKYAERKYGKDIMATDQWTLLGGGSHRGSDWVFLEDATVAGLHTEVGVFYIAPGVVVTVELNDGTNYGEFSVLAKQILIYGMLNGIGKGFGSGGGGGGGGGSGQGFAGIGSLGGLGRLSSGDGLPGQDGVVSVLADGGNGGNGGPGNGTYAGAGGVGGIVSDGGDGELGGYLGSEINGDVSVDDSVEIGSGGGGGAGGSGGGVDSASDIFAGGGGGGGTSGGAGGAKIRLIADTDIVIKGSVLSHGNVSTGLPTSGSDAAGTSGGNGGLGASVEETDVGTFVFPSPGTGGTGNPGEIFNGGRGGAGAGGGILLKAYRTITLDVNSVVGNLGGSGLTTNGGTVKLFTPEGRLSLAGSIQTGRQYESESLTLGASV